MEKQKKITLNADKRKVIADQFQSFYEDKVKDKLIQAKEQYDLMRCLLYTSPSPRDVEESRMPSSA